MASPSNISVLPRLTRQRVLPRRAAGFDHHDLRVVGERDRDVGIEGSAGPIRTTWAANSVPPSARWEVASRATCTILTGSGISSRRAPEGWPLPSQRSLECANNAERQPAAPAGRTASGRPRSPSRPRRRTCWPAAGLRGRAGTPAAKGPRPGARRRAAFRPVAATATRTGPGRRRSSAHRPRRIARRRSSHWRCSRRSSAGTRSTPARPRRARRGGGRTAASRRACCAARAPAGGRRRDPSRGTAPPPPPRCGPGPPPSARTPAHGTQRRRHSRPVSGVRGNATGTAGTAVRPFGTRQTPPEPGRKHPLLAENLAVDPRRRHRNGEPGQAVRAATPRPR